MADPKTVTLHDVPTQPQELEEYVAALFQSSQFFVEKHVIEREGTGTEILELDAVATSYDAAEPRSIIVEAKSGDWGFADIFKVLGWTQYLGVPQAAFFASKDVGKDNAFVQSKCLQTDVRFIHLGDFSDARERFTKAGFPKPADRHQVDLWRMSYWVERELIRRARAHAKGHPDEQGAKAILEHLHLINNVMFFTPDLRQRLLVSCNSGSHHKS